MLEVVLLRFVAWMAAATISLPTFCVVQAADDVVIADFEGEGYGSWKVEGEAFGKTPAKGTLPDQMSVEGYQGKQLVNSFAGGDDSTGRLTSGEFKIERPWISFLLGGGHHPGKTCINLIVDGKTVRTASGPNDRPGGSERLDWHSWDVQEFAGQTVKIEIVDNQTGGWGHINVDHIVQSDRRRGPTKATREIVAERRYLHLPVKNGAAKRVVKIRDGETTVREFEIELADMSSPDAEADYWAFLDLRPLAGKRLTVETVLPAESKAFDALKLSDALPSADKLYSEAQRPQFHFTSRRGWLNDPNGMVYHDGEWHLFYQHNPYGWNWGNMHWGHAVSRDLVHWEELPIALYPKQYGDWAFSGSAVVDKQNTSGFKTGDDEVLVLAYTSTGRGECIAYSNDRGRTWKEFDGNPVVKHKGRDPRLLWHEPTKRWVMAVYDEGQGQAIDFYSSADLKKWTFESKTPDFFECPDIRELPVDGDKDKTQWILYGADGKYLVGDFDGKKFSSQGGKHEVWHGDYYAAQTFTNAPNGRCVQIGWGRDVTFPGMPFNQQMTAPVELTLRTTPDGVRLFVEPVAELEKLRDSTATVTAENIELADGKNFLDRNEGELLDVAATLDVGDAKRIELTLRGAKIVYDAAAGTISCGKHVAKFDLNDGELKLRALVDRGSVELFAGSGRVAVSTAHRPAVGDRSMSLVAKGGSAKIESLEIYELQPTWRESAAQSSATPKKN
ncbi:MAG: glycoside hydrolase family 32 protein [Pirellulales bacterium]